MLNVNFTRPSSRALSILAAKFVCGMNAVVAASGGVMNVTAISPTLNQNNVPITATISVTFDEPVNPVTIDATSFSTFGRWSGPALGAFTYSNGNQTVTLTPNRPFSAGEQVTVQLSHDILAVGGSPLRAAGYGFRFTTRTRQACLTFDELDTMSNRTTPSAQTRIYGATASDLDRDGWLDIVTVNEVSADLRVFMNTDNGSGLFNPWLQPPAPGLFEMSPNEPADFNRDGFPDLCVASTATDKILVFIGNGNGTFADAQIITVNDAPLGITVLDVDGDGDTDIVSGNQVGNNLSLHLNDGTGIFGIPTTFEGGVNGEYGIASTDMNRDGIFDLVVGGNYNQVMRVMLGNGNGTFTPGPVQDIDGGVWQVSTGDLNNDGWDDVQTANSFWNSGSILLNNGAGGMLPAVTYPTGGHTPATDVGDLDGDGDLDWILSAFGGGLWRVFENDGTGTFISSQDFDAPNNPSCATLMDLDNDRDLDIVMLDEIADVMILMENTSRPGDINCDTVVNVADLLAVVGGWGPCPTPPPPVSCLSDISGDGVTNVQDLLMVISHWG